MKKWFIILIISVFVLIGLKLVWEYMVPSQDIQKSFKNIKADASGLDRIITHCVNDTDCITWQGVMKIYPFPDDKNPDGSYGGSGAGFSFTLEGKKIICGPGWRIIEK